MTDIDTELLQKQIEEMDRQIHLFKMGYDKYYMSLVQRRCHLLCQLGKAPVIIQNEYDRVQELQKEMSRKNNIDTYSYFVCVNPSPTVELQDFLSVCAKSVNKIWIETYCYVIEQRGKSLDEVGKGFHYHALITAKDGKKYSHIVREIANTFKKTTDVSNYHFFSIKPVSKEEHIRKLRYVVGYKQDDEKIEKQRIDVIFREQNNLRKCYNSVDYDYMGQYEEVK